MTPSHFLDTQKVESLFRNLLAMLRKGHQEIHRQEEASGKTAPWFSLEAGHVCSPAKLLVVESGGIQVMNLRDAFQVMEHRIECSIERLVVSSSFNTETRC